MSRADRQTDEQTSAQTKFLKSFEICWKVLNRKNNRPQKQENNLQNFDLICYLLKVVKIHLKQLQSKANLNYKHFSTLLIIVKSFIKYRFSTVQSSSCFKVLVYFIFRFSFLRLNEYLKNPFKHKYIENIYLTVLKSYLYKW